MSTLNNARPAYFAGLKYHDTKIDTNSLLDEQYQSLAKDMVGVAAWDDYEPYSREMKIMTGVIKKRGVKTIAPIPYIWIKRQVVILIDLYGMDNPVPERFVKAMKKAGLSVKALAFYWDGNKKVITNKPEEGRRFEIFPNDGSDSYYLEPASLDQLGTYLIYHQGSNGASSRFFYPDSEQSITLKLFNFSQSVANNLTMQAENLTCEEIVTLLKYLTYEDYDAGEDQSPKNVINYSSFGYKSTGLKASFYSDQDVVLEWNGRELPVNSANEMNGRLFSAKATAFSFLLTLAIGRGLDDRTIGGYLSGAATLFQVELNNYGREPGEDEVLSVIQRHTIKSFKAVSMSAENRRYPYFQIQKAPFNNSILTEVMDQGIPVMPDKYATERCAYGPGAEAQGVSMLPIREALKLPGFENELCYATEDYAMVMLFEAGKANARKLFNRHSQAWGASSADTADSVNFPIVESKFRTGTSIGDAKFYGWEVIAILCNSLFGHGSGPAVTRAKTWRNPATGELEDFALPYAIPKSLDGNISPHQVPEDFMQQMKKRSPDGERWMEQMIPLIEKRCAAQVGKVFTDGDEVLTLFASHPDRKFSPIIFTGMNQAVKVVDYRVWIDSVFYRINIRLDIELVDADNCIKFRGPGTKATNHHERIFFQAHPEGADGEYVSKLNKNWEILFPYECQKAQLAQVAAFCTAMGGGVYKDGYITLDHTGSDGKEVKVCLAEPGNMFELWVDDNVQLVYAKRTFARCYYEDVVNRNGGNLPGYEVLEDESDATSVTILEPMRVLLTPMVVQMEISSAHESVGEQAMTAEHIAASYAYAPCEAEAVWNDASEYHLGIQQAVQMCLYSGSAASSSSPQLVEGVPTLTLDDHKLIKKLITVTTENGAVLPRTGRKLYQYLAKKYPDGFNLLVGNTSFYIIPNAILQIGTFGNGGAATGLVGDMIALLQGMSIDPDERNEFWEKSLQGNLRRVIAGWKTSAGMGNRAGFVNSAGSLKKLGRTKKLLASGKVMTSGMRELHHNDGELPKVLLNPNCGIVRKLGVKTGSIIGMIRVPMIMPVYLQVVVTPKAMKSYMTLLPYVWAAGNEGDSDGDGCAAWKTSLTLHQALLANESIMCAGGYEYVYSNSSQPYSEFCSIKDAWGKKAIAYQGPTVEDGKVVDYPKVPKVLWGMGKHKYQMQTRFMAPAEFQDVAVLISNHYRIAVGVSYGWCSLASFIVGELAAKVISKMTFVKGDADLKLKVALAGDTYMSKILDDQGNPMLFIDVLKSKGMHEHANTLATAAKALKGWMKTTATVWRLVYEGLGLSGYTPEAKMFFDAVNYCVKNNTEYVPFFAYSDGTTGLDVTAEVTDAEAKGMHINLFVTLDGYNMDGVQGKQILLLEKMRQAYRAIELRGYQSAVRLFGEETCLKAIQYGLPRRTSQGSPFADRSEESMEGESTSLFTAAVNLLEPGCGYTNPVIASMCDRGVEVHMMITDQVKAREQMAMYM